LNFVTELLLLVQQTNSWQRTQNVVLINLVLYPIFALEIQQFVWEIYLYQMGLCADKQRWHSMEVLVTLRNTATEQASRARLINL
jgi:hypothetical protein